MSRNQIARASAPRKPSMAGPDAVLGEMEDRRRDRLA
jgi:hypothetical protein